MRHFAIIVLTFGLWVSAASAQENDAPIVRAEVSEDSIAVGQPVVLRVTILVPTWMPSPPQFPSFELPNVIVRLPERASGPVSEAINGETWSGVSRAYRMYPMVAGDFAIPGRPLRLTYAHPDTTDPITKELPLPPVAFTATVPKGAEVLDPMIVAEGLELKQVFEGPESTLAEGEAVKRIVTAQIKGTSALFLPPMIDPVENDAVQGYASEPVLKETENRGVLSGQRSETATYVARYGGTLELPEITLSWFNTTSGQVEVTTLEARDFTIEAPDKPREPLFTQRRTILLVAAVVLVSVLIWMVVRFAWPILRASIAARKTRHLASEAHAAQQVRAAIKARDLSRAASARAVWEMRLPLALPAQDQAFTDALLAVGAAQFRDQADAANWPAVARAFDAARKGRLKVAQHAAKASALPPLNPF